MTQIELANEILEKSNHSLFITGKAGCLSGDTLIYVGSYKPDGSIGNQGKTIKLKRLFDRFHGKNRKCDADLSKYGFAQSCRNDFYIQKNKITNVIYSGVKEVFEITTNLGYKIKATKDHLFLNSNNTYKKLEELNVNDEVVVYNRKSLPEGRKINQKNKELFVKYHPTNRIKIINNSTFYRITKPLFVLEADLNNLSLSEYRQRLNTKNVQNTKFIDLTGKEIHHKDRNRLNNSLDNLEIISIKEHHQEHRANKFLNAKYKATIDTIKSIKFVGIEDTYDITMTKNLPNFIANNFVVHNSGKSTLLKKFIETCKDKKTVVLAPTGIAAVNVEGGTIHSVFGLKPNISPEEIDDLGREKEVLKELEIMIVDEISMVRADLLDCMDIKLRMAKKSTRPFGGVRFIFFGDLSQLPPIVSREEEQSFLAKYKSPYFFEANVMSYIYAMGMMKVVELDQIFRQSDPKFIELLNEIRENKLSETNLSLVNSLCVNKKPADKTIYVCSTNAVANSINQNNLSKLTSKSKKFTGTVTGTFSQSSYPTDIELTLKEGARVMFCKNDSGKRFVNGSLGTITKIDKTIKVQIDNGDEIEVEKQQWSIFGYEKVGDLIQKRITGSFEQIPLKLAWAITVHKAQGKTFDNCVIDLGKGAFAHGQTYVALSRCTSLEGLSLTNPLTQKDIIFDNRINDFAEYYKNNLFY